MVFALCILNLFGLFALWVKFAEEGANRIYLMVFLSCYVFTYFGGIILAAALFSALGIEKIGSSDSTTWHLVMLSELCLIIFLIGYWVAAPLKKIVRNRSGLNWRNGTKPLGVTLIVSFLLAMVIYVAISGGPVLFKSGGYENRYDANVGLGGYSLFFSMGLLSCTLFSLRSRTKNEKRKAAMWTVVYCILTFIVLGGYRQLGFAAMFSLSVISLMRRDISFVKFLLLSIVLVVLALAVATFRYSDSGIHDMTGMYGRLFIFLYDGFAPVDAFYNIFEYCINRDIRENVMINQFATIVPRVIWPGKPLIVLNAGNFYTQQVLGRSGAITYSPTLLGELYLTGGAIACAVGVFISGVILRFLDEIIIRSANKAVVLFLFSFSFVFVFNLYREGLGVLVTKIFVFGVAFYFVLILSKLIFKNRQTV
ncbi:WzyE family oligosaccharide polymerase [Paraburkholderia tropica]|uniref:WzyE family oligosaccharide polymerase n=1 Tax=Paraburkholderia tropica TaxID=92647 RepID=UPI0021A2DA08|nr:WzyE family oligosaccharide polymerase [Paraburkholderia tropica]